MQKVFIIITLLILTLPSCLITKKKYDRLSEKNQKSIDSLEYALDKTLYDYKNAKNRNNALLQRNKDLIDSLIFETGKLSNDTSNLYNSLKEKQKRLVYLENMINQNKAEVNKLKNIIKDALKSFDNSELNVYLKNGKVYVAMEEKLLFKTGSSDIDERGKEAVIKLGKILEKNTDTEILIEGHTDNVGPDKYNWKLSTERALSVVNILTENTGIKANRITASGRGMHKPVASNADDTGKQKNRRIEIILVPKLDSLYKLMNE
ncbi:MAG: OmpA family protein [Bacteroidales bacterium]|nr:OmpA family protein [Bacteroidales bacterium]